MKQLPYFPSIEAVMEHILSQEDHGFAVMQAAFSLVLTNWDQDYPVEVNILYQMLPDKMKAKWPAWKDRTMSKLVKKGFYVVSPVKTRDEHLADQQEGLDMLEP
jgi:hypothetical protein